MCWTDAPAVAPTGLPAASVADAEDEEQQEADQEAAICVLMQDAL